jgi:Xaa-Pro aminopeptidase
MEKIIKLRRLFKKFKIDGYLVPKNDEFFGEYVPKNKDNLKYISNFSGSYGFALILKKKNYLFVDGRYTLQANKQSGKLFHINTIPKKTPANILKNKRLIIGYDPRLYTELSIDRLFRKTKCHLVPLKKNLVSEIWKNTKKEKIKKFFLLDSKYSGKGYEKKIKNLCVKVNKNKVDLQFISSPENVAWLLNLRGLDNAFSPIPNCYFILNKKGKSIIFCNLKKIDNKVRKGLKNIDFIDIIYLGRFLLNIKNKKIQIDKFSCSVLFKNILKKNNQVIELEDPIYLLKAIKNKVEIKNTIKSHIIDGAALTKFLFWVKENYKNINISEMSAQEKLLKFRKDNKNFKMLSFPTISGSGPNGAIIHYKVDKKSNRKLKKGDLYLIDSGGQYNFGTTDVTRTISLDNRNKKIKDIYTRVLKGHIAVANYNLNKNTSGSEIDFSARKFLREINLDYPHGTGHGVGYFLNVHEGPHGISRGNKIKFKEGMIVSNEPGYYRNGRYGIRIENLIAVKKSSNKLKFENLTMVPIDKSIIEKKLLDKKEIKWLNDYHKKVYSNLKIYMNKVEIMKLKESCSNI